MKNDVKLQHMGAVPIYYYMTANNKKVVTVCLIALKGEAIARGVSICSPMDCFNKRTGRAIALGRAMKALHHQKRMEPVNFYRAFKTATHPIIEPEHTFDMWHWKAMPNPTLNQFEEVLLERIHGELVAP